LKWVVDRITNSSDASLPQQTPIGLVPRPEQINTFGMDIANTTVKSLLTVNADNWRAEAAEIHKMFQQYGSEVPAFLLQYLNNLESSFDLSHSTPPTTNKALLDWVKEQVAVFQPDNVFWVDGSQEGKNFSEIRSLNNLKLWTY
jgi:GTP-dependent phosphoenolpyruvate carboxykinase